MGQSPSGEVALDGVSLESGNTLKAIAGFLVSGVRVYLVTIEMEQKG